MGERVEECDKTNGESKCDTLIALIGQRSAEWIHSVPTTAAETLFHFYKCIHYSEDSRRLVHLPVPTPSGKVYSDVGTHCGQ